jgi:hypothetical protein
MRESSNSAGTKSISVFQEGYIEVEKFLMSKKALETAHPGAVLGKAYINAKKNIN